MRHARLWLNKPCPQRNGNLYTERDFKLVKRMARNTALINLTLGWIVWLTPKEKRGKTERVSFRSDGRGFLTEAHVEPGGQWETLIQKSSGA